jgi:hypothetical protein
MKSHITVLIDSSSVKIIEELKKALELHRLDENNIESIRAYHWDYWYFPADKNLNDSDLKLKFPNESDDVLKNTAFIKNLPKDYLTSGVICKDGVWIDLQDYGWRMLNEPSISNNIAMEKWLLKLREIFSENKDEICVQVITHC